MQLHNKQKAPEFVLADQNEKTHSLKKYLGKWVVLYFYPKDDTPGCTAEACGFRDQCYDVGVYLDKEGFEKMNKKLT